ncbi:MAG: AmmeMemoRadiSam system protein B [Rhodothermales bacterium]|nr:AmmeMemoRadiSam system protein B [Rhodothermales bacterium]
MVANEHAVYATQPRPLRQQIEEHLRAARPEPIDGEIFAVIVPDANLRSGAEVSAAVYKLLQGRTYDTVLLIAPSHSGSFRRITICSLDTYQTPLGAVPVDDRVRHELCDEDDDIFLDDVGHFHTEGIDVQLPYLQATLASFSAVPIVMGDESPVFCRELGQAVGEVSFNRRTLVVASADVLEADAEALEAFRTYFEAADVERLMTLFNSERMRVEGKGGIVTALLAAQHRHVPHARLIALDAPEGGRPGRIGAVLWR